MSKVELLCPAGNYEAFLAALYNGADAIFMAGNQYGARASATNFTIEQIKEATELAHLFGVKIHITLNTLIHDKELENCKAYLKQLESIGVDAIIVQDLGIMNIIQHEFPSLNIHASTQMHIHNIEGVKQAKKWNLERCVVARETNLELVKEMCQQDIEIETFIQGAYCVSYSGECHMSRNIGGRSANRGECAQTCRLPYTLYKNNQLIETEGKYLLSLKDLSALPLIPELIESGVSSFKIEGRMKRPEYVACMCSVYRQAIDAYYKNEKFDIKEEMIEEMKKVFNRGFTSGYLENKEGLSIMSTIRPNHQGVRIGKIVGFHHDKMVVSLEKELNQHDGIRILNDKEDQGFIVNYIYKNGKLVSNANKEIIELQKVKARVGDIIMKTSDVKQLTELSKNPARKVEVSMKVILHKNKPVLLTICDDENEITVESDILVEKALNVPLEVNRIKQQLTKLGNTPFTCTNIEIDMEDDISYPISKLNEIRRNACDAFIEKRKTKKVNVIEKKEYQSKEVEITHELHVSVLNEEQYEAVKEYPVEIYVSNRNLYEKVKGDHVHFDYPRVTQDGYNESGKIHDIGGIVCGGIASSYMNCMNAYCANVLFNEGIKCISLSYECSDDDIALLLSDYKRIFGHKGNFEVEVYGRNENMVLENCIIKSQLKTKKHCNLCHNNVFTLKDMKNKSYRLIGDENCRMKVYHSEPLNKIDKIDDYQKMGITNFGVSFTFEDKNEVKNILNSVMKLMKKVS